jgi:hypothetical protein
MIRERGGEEVNKKLREYSDLCHIAKLCGGPKKLLEKAFQQGYHQGWWNCFKSVLLSLSGKTRRG